MAEIAGPGGSYVCVRPSPYGDYFRIDVFDAADCRIVILGGYGARYSFDPEEAAEGHYNLIVGAGDGWIGPFDRTGTEALAAALGTGIPPWAE